MNTNKKTTGDYTLDWMYRNLPPDKWNLELYVTINWCGEMTISEVLEDGELLRELPEELYPEPASKLIQ